MNQKPKPQQRDRIKPITGLIGTGLMVVFILGLSHSISTGFAGFEGGLPFLVIACFVILLAVWDYIDECLRKR